MLTDAQRRLAEYMSDLSEIAYSAGWQENTEYRLWRFLVDSSDDGEWGRLVLDQAARDQLRSLSNEAGGWIYFDAGKAEPSDCGMVFATATAWSRIYEAANRSNGPRSPKG